MTTEPQEAAAGTASESWTWPSRPAAEAQGGKPCSVHSKVDRGPTGTKALVSWLPASSRDTFLPAVQPCHQREAISREDD